jgi:hypothetical protein
MSNFSTISSDEPHPELDELLHDYFQAEMPHPWPAFKAPSAARPMQPAMTLRSRYSGRLALAACVALLVAGYWSLSGCFPHTQSATGVQELHNISQREKGPKATPQTHSADEPMPMPIGNPTTKSKSN